MAGKNSLHKEILTILETIPGILEFESIIENENEVIKCEMNDNKIDIFLGVVINRNVTSKAISKEILEALNFHFKNKLNNKFTLNKVNIFIKGVK